MDISVVVGFGGVFLVGVGFMIAWFWLERAEKNKSAERKQRAKGARRRA